MDSFPPAHGPASHLDDLTVGLADGSDDDTAAEARDLPEVAEAVTGRARDLHRLADRLGAGDTSDATGGTTLSAVALLRAHAGAVDALAEHLLAAADDEGAGAVGHAADAADADARAAEAGGSRPSAPGPRGVPRGVG